MSVIKKLLVVTPLLFGLSTMGCGEVRDDPPRALEGGVVPVSTPDGVPATVYRDTLPACPECRVEVRSRGTLGSLSDSILLRRQSVLALRDGLGRTYATAANTADQEIIVYDSLGRIVRTVGRPGEGPGEFRVVRDMFIGGGDTLYVLDTRGRISVFDTAGAPVRTVNLDPAGFSWAQLLHADGSGFLLNVDFRSPELRRHPWHEFDATGSHVRGFGPQGDYLTVVEAGGRPLALMMRRFTAFEPDGDLMWIQEGTGVGYRLEALGPDGEVVRRIGLQPHGWRGMPRLQMTVDDVRARRDEVRRQASSAQPPEWDRADVENRPRPERPSPPAITGIHALGEGLLLVLLQVAGPEWDRAVEYDMTFPDEPQVVPHSTRGRHATVLDLIDTRTGELLARAELEERIRLGRDGTLYRILLPDSGLIGIEVLELELTIPEARRPGEGT